MNVNEKLKDIGLSDKAASVYLTILQIGEGSVTEIAALSKIKRTTCLLVTVSLFFKNSSVRAM